MVDLHCDVTDVGRVPEDLYAGSAGSAGSDYNVLLS